jgi:hypothetical protein
MKLMKMEERGYFEVIWRTFGILKCVEVTLFHLVKQVWKKWDTLSKNEDSILQEQAKLAIQRSSFLDSNLVHS